MAYSTVKPLAAGCIGAYFSDLVLLVSIAPADAARAHRANGTAQCTPPLSRRIVRTIWPCPLTIVTRLPAMS